MIFQVYVLANVRGDIYVGQTSDLERRLAQHNDPNFMGTLHTKRRQGPWRLIYSESCQTRSAALRRERQLKTAASRRFLRKYMEESRR